MGRQIGTVKQADKLFWKYNIAVILDTSVDLHD